MSALPTPKIVDLDDPLTPRRDKPAAPTAPAAPARARRPAAARTAKKKTTAARSATAAANSSSFADEPLVAVFARLPESLSDRLAEGVRAINAGRPRRGRVSQQDVLGALVDEHVTPDDAAALGELVDAYRERIRR